MICVNDKVYDKYFSGMSLNDAIAEVHMDEINDKSANSESFAKLTPIQMVMHEACITKNAKIGDMTEWDKHKKKFDWRNPDINNAIYTSGGMETNQWLFPAWVETTLRETMAERSLLPYVCNTTMPIDGNTIQSPMLNMFSDTNKPALRRARIAEGADLPTGKITLGERAITLWKHGRAIEFTYEAARRMRVDLFTRQMNAIIADITDQNMGYATDVLINGDGNPDTAATKIGTTTTANSITAKDIIHALVEYENANHFSADTVIVPRKYLESISQLMYDPTLAVGAGLNVSFNIPQLSNQNITIIGNENAVIGNKDAMILLNRDSTLIRYEENGSNIHEMENFIQNQTRLMTMSENSGYAISTAGSNMYVEVKSA